MKSFVESHSQATMTDTLFSTRERWIHEWKIGRRTVINRTRIRKEVETKTNMKIVTQEVL